jgi:hypothetical protein
LENQTYQFTRTSTTKYRVPAHDQRINKMKENQ